MKEKTLIEAIVSTAIALENCKRSNNEEWIEKHNETLKRLTNYLPSGSGVDSGTTIESISATKVVFACGYHHMNDAGYYDGWTHHKITATSTFQGLALKVSGPDRNNIKESLADLFHNCLTQTVNE